ncbi:MAG: hypothetical protein AAGH74_15355 [Pseudomonadota bacterium]
MDIYFLEDETVGWSTIFHVMEMIERLFGGHVETIRSPRKSLVGRAIARNRPVDRRGSSIALFVARGPHEVGRFMQTEAFAKSRKFRAIWLIDSFWTEMLPKGSLRQFDLICYTQAFERDFYETRFGERALLMSIGTDALDLGRLGTERTIDLLRVGRQPSAWEDDAASAMVANELDLRFHGRPPYLEVGRPLQVDLMENWFSKSKFVLAQTNLVDDSRYTHPSKSYITGRWTDALACGASVAGVAPEDDIAMIDWPGALLRFPKVDLRENLAQVADAARAWSPEQAKANHLASLRHLDWRWRLRDLADRLPVDTSALDAELDRLKARIRELEDVRAG